VFNRRRVLISALIAPTFGAVAGRGWAAEDLFADLESRSGGRLGVAALDVKTGRRLAHRPSERFPMCSTFKFLAVALVLKHTAHEPQLLNLIIPYGQADLVDYSPITKLHVAEGGMSLGDLCEAAITHSDNTAGNLLLSYLGQSFNGVLDSTGRNSPLAFTAHVRMDLKDGVSRLDRRETELNEARPGDRRDTTSPAAMLADMRRILLGGFLPEPERNRLTGWLIANTTGGNRIRAGMPDGWIVGDKTGSGSNGTTNDIAIIWPEGREKPPILLAAYLTGSTLDAPSRDQIIAQTARAAAHLMRGAPNHG
jgi:beta-lactamase class A